MIELLAILAVWRLSSLLTRPTDSGPFEIFARLRDATGIKYDERGHCVHPAWNPLCCIWCASMWVALPVTIYFWAYKNYNFVESIILWFALSAGAIIMERVIDYARG